MNSKHNMPKQKNKKTRIFFFLDTINAGGAEKVTVNIIRQLDKNKYEVYLSIVYVDKLDYIKLIPEHVNLILLDAKRSFFSILKLRKEIKRIKPDIVYTTLYPASAVMYMTLFFFKKKPLVICRNPTTPKVSFDYDNRLIDKLRLFFIKKAYQKANVILSQTDEMKGQIAEFFEVPTQKIIVFINPVDSQTIDANINKKSSPFDKNKINIVATGSLSRIKGFDILIKAFKKVVEKNDKFQLHIIGRDAGEGDSLKALRDDLGLEKQVIFLGYQENPYQFFYHADLYVLSSRFEGLPNTVLENLYLKKPIIATKCIPAMTRLIEDAKTGFVVDIEDPDGLANAILRYKEINNSVATTAEFGDANQLFQEIKDRL